MRAFIGLTFISLFILAVIGWVINLFAFVGLVAGGATAELIVRGVGIFAAPLGSLLGWML
jgi:hypothetical protein